MKCGDVKIEIVRSNRTVDNEIVFDDIESRVNEVLMLNRDKEFIKAEVMSDKKVMLVIGK